MSETGSGLGFNGEATNDGVVFETALYLDENDNVTDDVSKGRWLLVGAGGTLTSDLARKYGLDGKQAPEVSEKEEPETKKVTPANKKRTPSGDK